MNSSRMQFYVAREHLSMKNDLDILGTNATDFFIFEISETRREMLAIGA